MNRLLGMVIALGLALLMGQDTGWAQLQPGPGNQPATLKNPWLEGSAPANQGLPFLPNAPAAANNLPFAGQPMPAAPAPQNRPDPNQDILVTASQGPAMICVHWYSGPEAPAMARQMVMELRDHYRLPAYVFNHGAEERRKEDERARAIVEQQREFFRQKGLPLDTPLRVRRMRIEEQCAVLVGGYKDDETARRALDGIRKLDMPGTVREKLNTTIYQVFDEKTGKVSTQERVNPFTKAFVVRNPAVKFERPREWDQPDLAALHNFNRGEDYSLLTCKKPFTLVIKQFTTASAVQPRSSVGTFLETLGLGKTNDGIDTAAQNAHNLAELMRKSFQLEAYVLHTRYSSMVSVGGFDGPDDPRLRSMQELLTNRYKAPSAIPMAVPR